MLNTRRTILPTLLKFGHEIILCHICWFLNFYVSENSWGFSVFKGHITTATVLRISSEAANKQVKKNLASYLLSYLILEGFLNLRKKELF